MKKTAILIMVLTIISKAIGLLRDIVLSYFYGASSLSDVYLVSLTIPGVIFSFIGLGISTGYIPLYSNILKDGSEREGLLFTNKLIHVLLILCTFIIAFSFLFTKQIIWIFASGFDGETLQLAVKFTRFSILGIYFTALSYVFTGFLQLKDNYTIPAMIGFPLNFCIIASIIVSSFTNIMVLAIGSTIALCSELLLLIPFARKKGYQYQFRIDFKDKHIKKMAYIGLPIIIGASVNQINILIDRTLASQIVVGGISALNYASKLNLFIQGIFVLSIVTAIYPTISKMVTESNMEGLKKIVSSAVTAVNLLVLPATVGAMLFAGPVVELLFGRGAFNDQAVLLTTTALFFYSIGMIGYGLREVLSRAFYAMQDTKTPMINAAVGMFMNIVLNIILSRFLGIGGLALATSIAAIFTSALLFISLRKKVGPFGVKAVIAKTAKMLVASLLMGAIAKVSFDSFLSVTSQTISLFIAVGIGALAYFILIYFMKIDDVQTIIKTVKQRFRKPTV